MSQDLLEVGAVIAAVVVLTALFHRVVQPLLELLATGRPHPTSAAGVVGAGLDRRPQEPRSAAPHRLDSPA